MTRETKPNSTAGPNPQNQEASSCLRNRTGQETQERRRAQIQVKILRHWCCQESQQRLTAEAESAGARKTNGAETGSTVQAAAGGRELGRGRNPRRVEGFQEGGEAQGGSSSNCGGAVGWFRRAWARDGWGKAPRKQWGARWGWGCFVIYHLVFFILSFFSPFFESSAAFYFIFVYIEGRESVVASERKDKWSGSMGGLRSSAVDCSDRRVGPTSGWAHVQ